MILAGRPQPNITAEAVVRADRDDADRANGFDFLRFLRRWAHVAPGTQLRGYGGVRIAVEQLQGFEAAAAAWEPEILRRRVADYQPAHLDRLCHDGEVTWLRLTPNQPASDRRSSPSKATPVAVVFREDLPWLLQAARLAPPSATVREAVAPLRASRPPLRAALGSLAATCAPTELGRRGTR